MSFISAIDARTIEDAPTMARALRCVIMDIFDPDCVLIAPRLCHPKGAPPRVLFRPDDIDFAVGDSDGHRAFHVFVVEETRDPLMVLIDLARSMGVEAAVARLQEAAGTPADDDDDDEEDDDEEDDEPEPAGPGPGLPPGRVRFHLN